MQVADICIITLNPENPSKNAAMERESQWAIPALSSKAPQSSFGNTALRLPKNTTQPQTTKVLMLLLFINSPMLPDGRERLGSMRLSFFESINGFSITALSAAVASISAAR